MVAPAMSMIRLEDMENIALGGAPKFYNQILL